MEQVQKTAPDVLPAAVRAPLESLKAAATSLRGVVEGYLASLEAELITAYGPDACAQMEMANCLRKVREPLHALIRLDECGDVWGAVGSLEEEVLRVAVEDEQRTLLREEERAA